MLSILPFDRVNQRDCDRPFKAYPRVPSSLPTTSFYAPFSSPPSFGVGSYFSGAAGLTSHAGLSSHGVKTSSSDYPSSAPPPPPPSVSGTMDLRPPPHHLDTMPSLMDISQATPTGHPLGPNSLRSMGGHHGLSIKQEPRIACPMPPVSGSQPLPTYQPHSEQQQQHHHHPQQQHSHHHQPQQQQQPVLPTVPSCARASSTSTTTAEVLPTPRVESHQDNHHMEQSFKVPPKKRPLAVPGELKDSTYWDKRKKNNDSARRSRDARRMKEEQIAMRVVYLEQENLQLRTEVSLLKSEIEKLRCMLYNS